MINTDAIIPCSFIGDIGIAQNPITPPLGIYSRCWGAAKHDCASSTHREQMLTAIYFHAQGQDPLLLIAMEIPWMNQAAWQLMRQTAAEASGITQTERIIINCNHNHSSAPIEDIDLDCDGADLIQAYKEQCRLCLEQSVHEAINRAQPAQLSVESGRCNLARNRDLKTDDQGPIFCGYNPAQQADDTLLVARITAQADGSILGCLVNYACHPTTLAWENTALSPDFIGAMRSTVSDYINAPCCFLQGASGELSARQAHQGETDVADKQGRQLAYAVLSCLEGMIDASQQLDFAGTIASGADLAYWRPNDLSVQEHMQQLHAEVIEFELDIKADWPSIGEFQALYEQCDDRVMKERYRRRLNNRRALGDGSSSKHHFWYWRIGELQFFASPFECYSNFQVDLRHAFPSEEIMVCNLSNGSSSYLVPQELYSETLYQKDLSPYAAGCLERITSAALEACTPVRHHSAQQVSHT